MNSLIEILVVNGVDRGQAPHVLRQVFQPMVEAIASTIAKNQLDANLGVRNFNRPYTSYTKVRIWNEGYLDALKAILQIIRAFVERE